MLAGNLVSTCRNWRIKTVQSGFVAIESLHWIGEIKKLSTDRNGDASVDIQIANGIKLSSKKIKSSESIYESLAAADEEVKVVFSGIFRVHNDFMTSGYFLQTSNITEKGPLIDPTFVFKLTNIKPFK